MFFLGEIEHRFGSVDSFSRFYRVIAQSKDSAWRILDKLASADSISPYPSAERPMKGSYVRDGHLVIVDAIVELDAQAFHSKALERFPLLSDGSDEPPEDFPEYVKEIARRLGRSLTSRNAEVAQSVLLHAISASIGETDWQKLRTKFKHQVDPDTASRGTSTSVAGTEGEQAVACVDENDEGLFVDIVYGEGGSPLKRGDLLYTRASALRTGATLGNKRILELARYHAIDHEHWSPERCVAFAHDILASGEQTTRDMQAELERLYHQAEGAQGLGGERHMQRTLADIAERLLNLRAPTGKDAIKEPEGVSEATLEIVDRLVAKVEPGSLTVVLRDDALQVGNSGIAAGCLRDRVGRPTFLFHAGKNGELLGGARTVSGFDVTSAVTDIYARHRDIFITYGGHETAVALALKADTLEIFAKALEDVAREYLGFESTQ